MIICYREQPSSATSSDDTLRKLDWSIEGRWLEIFSPQSIGSTKKICSHDYEFIHAQIMIKLWLIVQIDSLH